MFRRSALRWRESWEFEPTPEHRSLVLLLYRHMLKGLLQLKSVRRRSLLAYCRMCTRKRSKATEQLLIDECIEEARRAIYVLQKNIDMVHTKEYQFDSMALPKDTGQDVKTFMEEHYDPEASRQHFMQFQDVVPGKEHLHQQGMAPASGEFQARRKGTFKEGSEDGESGGDGERNSLVGNFKITIPDEYKMMRPPRPPTEPPV